MYTTMTLRATHKQKELISEYSKMHGETMSGYILEIVLERIEDEIDLRDMKVAIRESWSEPETCTHDEIKKEFEL